MNAIETPATVKIEGVDNLGSPGNSASVTVSPDGQELSILFDNLSIANGRVNRSLSIPISVPLGYQFSQYTADYRGFIPTNTTANLQVAYSFAGQNGLGFNQTFQNETNYDVQDDFVTLANVRSTFGNVINLHINLSLTATGSGTAIIDSLDLAHLGKVSYPSSPPINITGNDSTPELFDFRGNATGIDATFSIYRDAVYNNTVYFYALQDETGKVFDPLTRQILQPTDPGYLQAALRNAVADVALSTPDQTTTTFHATLPSGSLLAPAIVINSTKDTLLDNSIDNDPKVYTPFVLGNTDRVDHMLRLGNNNLVFEDLDGGGDLDYNDIILITSFQPLV